MVDTSITATLIRLNVDLSESTTTIQGNLADYRGVSIEQLQNVEDPNSNQLETDYNFLVASSGAAGPVVANLHYRDFVKTVGDPLIIPSFFTGVRIGVDDQFHVEQKLDIAQGVFYDCFFTWEDVLGTLTDLDLSITTVEVPDSESTVPQAGIPLPAVPNATDPVHSKAVLRSVAGGVRVYDIFTLYQP